MLEGHGLLVMFWYTHKYGVVHDRASREVQCAACRTGSLFAKSRLVLSLVINFLSWLVPFPVPLPRYLPLPLPFEFPGEWAVSIRWMVTAISINFLHKNVSHESTPVGWRLPPRCQPPLLAAVTAWHLSRRLLPAADHPDQQG